MTGKQFRLVATCCWASYLINGDASGISAEDKAMADAWIEREDLGDPVDCNEFGFVRHHDDWLECPGGADCQEYAFLA